jgi:predicted dehydrogenase
MGRNHLRVLATMAEYELVGCHDSNQEAARSLAAQYGIRAFSSPAELFDAVDVVTIVVPSSLHRDLSVAAAGQGCHVLVEKPIALNADDAQAIIDACDRAGVRLCVGHVERYNPAVETLQGIMAQESLISVDFRRMSPFYSRTADASVVQDLMIHDIDILNALIDAPIQRLVSQGRSIRTDQLDFAQALIRYESGALASLTASRITESKIRRIDISASNSYISVDCLNRTVEISRKTNFSLDVGYPVQYRQENIVEKVIVPINEPLRSEFAHFAHAIRTAGPIATSGEMGKQAVMLCQLIQDEAMQAG